MRWPSCCCSEGLTRRCVCVWKVKWRIGSVHQEVTILLLERGANPQVRMKGERVTREGMVKGVR